MITLFQEEVNVKRSLDLMRAKRNAIHSELVAFRCHRPWEVNEIMSRMEGWRILLDAEIHELKYLEHLVSSGLLGTKGQPK